MNKKITELLKVVDMQAHIYKRKILVRMDYHKPILGREFWHFWSENWVISLYNLEDAKEAKMAIEEKGHEVIDMNCFHREAK